MKGFCLSGIHPRSKINPVKTPANPILTPISLIVRLFGKDLLGLKFTNQTKTYWIKRKKDLNSMNKQF